MVTMSFGQCQTLFNIRRKYNRCDPFAHTESTCPCHFRSMGSITPRCIVCCTPTISVLSSNMGGTTGGLPGKHATVSLDFSQLSVISLIAAQSLASLADSCSYSLRAEIAEPHDQLKLLITKQMIKCSNQVQKSSVMS